MPQMSEKLVAARLEVALERVQVQERVDAADDSTRVNMAAERLATLLAVAHR